jgi:hypothetical protein
MRQWRHIFDYFNRDPRRLQARDRTFAASTRSLNPHFDFFDAVLCSTLGTDFRSTLSSERGALTATLESGSTGGCPAQHIATGIGDRHQRVVERSFHVGYGLRHVLSDLFSFRFRHRTHFQDSGNVRQRTTDWISASYPSLPFSLRLSS